MLAWHGIIIQKAKANLGDICVQAHKIFGAVGIGNNNQQAQNANPKVRTCVGLDSESESEEEGEAGPSCCELEIIDNLKCYECVTVDVENNDGSETEAILGTSCLGGHHGTKAHHK